MNVLSRLANYARSPGDPTIIKAGPSVRPASDETARLLGWVSIGLGAFQLAAPHAISRFLGMQGREGLVRVYGVREIAAGMTSLSTDTQAGLWSRAGGDVMDIVTLLTAYRDDNPKRHNVGLALAAVVAISLIDFGSAKANTASHARKKRASPDYGGRGGFPQGVRAAKGSAARTAP